MMPLSIDQVLTSLNLDGPSCWQLWSPRLDTLFSPDNVFLMSSLALAQSTSCTPLCYKACAKYFLVLLRTPKLAQFTSQCYFVLQDLRKVVKYFPTLLCTTGLAQGYFPVLCCTTKVAQSTSQYFVLTTQLAQAPSSTTSYYKACTKYFPVLLCTTKPTEFTSQYYFVLQDFHKVLPGPVLLCSTRLAQNTSQYSMSPCGLCTSLLQKETFKHRNCCTQKLLRREAFTHRSF